MKYSQAELDYAVAQARLEYYQKWYELGREHLQAIKDIPVIDF